MLIHNTEAEKAILGCMIIDNNLIKKVQANFKPEYFYTTMNQSMYLEILRLYEQHRAVDMPMLFEFNIDYVSEICKAIATTQNVRQYVSIVRNLGIRRELIKASEKVRDIAMDDEIDDIDIIKSEALAVVNNVQLPEVRKTNIDAIDIVTNSITNLEKLYKNGSNVYYNWGLPWLQDKTGGVKPEYTILAARPSVGKTAFALQLGKAVALQGKKVAIFSLEMPSESCTNRMICNQGGIDKDFFDKPTTLNDKAWEMIGRTAPIIAMLPLTIYDDVFYIEELVLKCEELKASKGLDFVIIDYIQLLETRQKTNSTNDRVSHISRCIKKLQQRNKLHLLVLSQFNRESETQQIPTLRNLRDSGSLEQDASNVWFLHVDPANMEAKDGYVETQFIIAKQREGERNIKRKLKFYGKTQKFYDN